MQCKVSQKAFVLEKVGTDDNFADALTKGVDATAIQYRLDCVMIGIRYAGARSHPNWMTQALALKSRWKVSEVNRRNHSRGVIVFQCIFDEFTTRNLKVGLQPRVTS